MIMAIVCRQVPLVVQHKGVYVVRMGCRSRKCIRCHMQFFIIRVLSLLGLQTRPEDRPVLLLSSRPSSITRRPSALWRSFFVHAIASAQKVVCFGSPGWISMIQPLFTWVALQYQIFHRAVPELHAVKYCAFQRTYGNIHSFSLVLANLLHCHSRNKARSMSEDVIVKQFTQHLWNQLLNLRHRHRQHLR